jgi:hypothetical protein
LRHAQLSFKRGSGSGIVRFRVARGKRWVAMGSCGAMLVVGVGFVRLWRRAVPALPTTTSAGNNPRGGALLAAPRQ